MKKNNPGFSLIELMITLLIGSMIIAGLFSTLYQVGRAQITIDTITDVHQRAAILFNHLERDIMGAFIPEQVNPIKKPKKDGDDTEKEKIINKIFWAKAREDKNIETLTFITNNPLEVYLGAKNSEPKPRVARIVYRVQPQKGAKDSFIITRQEGAQLNYDLYKKKADIKKVQPAYEMISDIASLSITFLALDAKKSKETKKQEYTKSKDWNSDKKSDSEKKKGVQYKLPEFVEIALSLWDINHEKKFAFNYTIPVMYRKGKPKKKASSFAKASADKKNRPKGPPSISTKDGKVTVTRNEKGEFVITKVPA